MLKEKTQHNPYDPKETEEARKERIKLFEEVMAKHVQIRETSSESEYTELSDKNDESPKQKMKDQ